MFSAISLGVFCRLAPLDQGDHPVDERLARLLGDLDDDAVREDLRSAGDRTAVAAALADDWCGLTGDRGLIDTGDAVDDVAVAGDRVTGLADDAVALQQFRCRHRFFSTTQGGAVDETSSHGVGLRPAQRIGLCLTAALGDSLGQVGEQHGQPKKHDDQPRERRGVAYRDHGGEHRAELDDEHHGVLVQRARIELGQRAGQRRQEHAWIEQSALHAVRFVRILRGGWDGLRLGPDQQ